MSDYIIMTDSSCDLPAGLAQKMNLTVLPLFVYIDDRKYTNYLDEREIAFRDIYAKLRTKCPAKTSAVNMNDFMEPMERLLKSGKDVLYIGFSSGLSGTYNAGAAAAQETSLFKGRLTSDSHLIASASKKTLRKARFLIPYLSGKDRIAFYNLETGYLFRILWNRIKMHKQR